MTYRKWEPGIYVLRASAREELAQQRQDGNWMRFGENEYLEGVDDDGKGNWHVIAGPIGLTEIIELRPVKSSDTTPDIDSEDDSLLDRVAILEEGQKKIRGVKGYLETSRRLDKLENLLDRIAALEKGISLTAKRRELSQQILDAMPQLLRDRLDAVVEEQKKTREWLRGHEHTGLRLAKLEEAVLMLSKGQTESYRAQNPGNERSGK